MAVIIHIFIENKEDFIDVVKLQKRRDHIQWLQKILSVVHEIKKVEFS